MTTLNRKKSAVSLKYDREQDQAPRVTAKGQGVIADNIIRLAKENNIPIKEDPDLVQILSQVDINQEIPPSVYQIVAELLAFVYNLNQEYPNPLFQGFLPAQDPLEGVDSGPSVWYLFQNKGVIVSPAGKLCPLDQPG